MPDPTSFPSAPSQPEASNVSHDSLDLSWNAPEKNGVGPVSGYVLQYYSPEEAQVNLLKIKSNRLIKIYKFSWWKFDYKSFDFDLIPNINNNMICNFVRHGTTWTTTSPGRSIACAISSHPNRISSLWGQRTNMASDLPLLCPPVRPQRSPRLMVIISLFFIPPRN